MVCSCKIWLIVIGIVLYIYEVFMQHNIHEMYIITLFCVKLVIVCCVLIF